VHFYRSKGTTYNAWLTVPTLYTFLGCLPCKAHQWLTSEDLEARRSLEMCTTLEARRHVCLSKLLTARLSLTGRRTIARTKSCIILFGLYPSYGMHHGSDKHLTCGDETNLDCCNMMTTTIDYDMTIITLDNFTLRCLVGPLLPMLYVQYE
jgi:hypothetical protein